MALTFDFTRRQWYQNAANADTTGNTTGNNETEINQLKAALRDAGVLKPT